MENRIIFDRFSRQKPFAILNVLRTTKEKIDTAELARRAECSYYHVLKLLVLLQKEGILTFIEGRNKQMISLTKKGSQLAELTSKLREILEYNGRKP